MTRVRSVIFLTTFAACAGACSDKSCLRGEANCRVDSPCTRVASMCVDDDELEIVMLDGTNYPGTGRGKTLGGKGDVMLRNSQIEVVISGIGNQNYLDIAGGSILDIRPRDSDVDAIAGISQAVGILPEDEPNYTTLEIIDERPTRIAVQARGALYKHADEPFYTLYELRPCDGFLRVRSEVVNRTPDPHLWTLSDAFYWSVRSASPFTPTTAAGFFHPDLDLLSINNEIITTPFVAAPTPAGPDTGFAAVSCSTSDLSGFQSPVVSTAGLPQTVVTPRGYLIFERAIAVTSGRGVSHAIDAAFDLRAALWGDETVTISGRITQPTTFHSFTDLGLEISEPIGTQFRPWTFISPDSDGKFIARVPRGKHLVMRARRFGLDATSDTDLGAFESNRDLGNLAIVGFDTPSHVTVTVADADGAALPAELYVVAHDTPTRAQVTGSFYGVDADLNCAPYLGLSPGASPACQMVLVPPTGTVAFDVPDGTYDVYAYHGLFFSLAQLPLVGNGDAASLAFTLHALPALRPAGALSADLHVHGAASFDSAIPDEDRVLAFVASDTDVIIATDHDVVYDYGDVVRALGVDDRVVTVTGVETTGHVPYLAVPGDPFPHVIGHYNFWPLPYLPGTPRNGAPFDEFIEPGELFGRVAPLVSSPLPIFQLNHPMLPAEGGRDLGFPRAIHLDLTQPLPVGAHDDGKAGGLFVRASGSGQFSYTNDAYHTQEVMNGSGNIGLLEDRAFWFFMLNEGRPRVGTANSDSHSLADNTVGSPRNLVFAATQKNSFEIDAFNFALRAGTTYGTNGPLIDAVIRDADGDEHGYGMDVLTAAAGAMLHVEVHAAPWVIVDEIRIIVNGVITQTIDGTALTTPADPFGTDVSARYVGDLPLADLLAKSGGADAWIVVEAGARLPLYADLGGGADNRPDGIPDTGDNNGDGVVDRGDIEGGDDVGPLVQPAMPAADDPRRYFYRVMHGGYPYAFTNPFLIDRNGNGRFDGSAP